MDIKIKNVNIVYNSNKNIFEYPTDTLLDKICVDIWGDIMRYLNYQPFIVSDGKTPVFGYRKMKKEEFKIYKNSFLAYYYQNERIIYGLEKYEIKNSTLLSIDDYLIGARYGIGSFVFCYNEVDRGEKGITFDNMNDIYLSEIMACTYSNKHLTLMISENLIS